MNNEKRTNGRQTVERDSEFEPDFSEIEIGRSTDAEYEMANLLLARFTKIGPKFVFAEI